MDRDKRHPSRPSSYASKKKTRLRREEAHRVHFESDSSSVTVPTAHVVKKDEDISFPALGLSFDGISLPSIERAFSRSTARHGAAVLHRLG